MSIPEIKKCQLCKFTGYYCYHTSDNNLYCPICIENISETFYSEENFHYNYCKECKIIFRYNELNIHHHLYDTGKLYYAEIIDKYTCFNNVFNFCPKFEDFNKERCNEFINLYNNNIIKIEWINNISFNECCVCFNETSHYTECCHSVCTDCLKPLQNCPICRHKLKYTVYQNQILLEDNYITDLILDGGPGSYPEDDEENYTDLILDGGPGSYPEDEDVYIVSLTQHGNHLDLEEIIDEEDISSVVSID